MFGLEKNDQTKTTMPNSAAILKQKFANSFGLPFQTLLPESVIAEVLAAEGVKYRNRIFSPFVTLWAFLSQVLDADKSSRNAVSRVIAWLAGSGQEVPSDNTGGYTQAKQRLPEGVFKRLFEQTGRQMEQQVPDVELWCGRHVKLLDGSNVSMPDTAANQEAYPQHSNQKAGCGFPIAKLVVMFSLATGAAIAVVIDQFKVSELELARCLYASLEPGDIGLADRAYGSYVDLASVQARGADGVFRCHQRRSCDFRRGQRLGKDDHLVTWDKPKRCPKHMSQEAFAQLPDSLTVREVRFQVVQPGYRTKTIIVVTTLLDAKRYSKSQLAELYRWRWNVEVDLKHVKTTLQMEILRGKSPEMVRKELYVHLLAYNLLRSLMAQAAQISGISPLRLSLQGTRQHFRNFISELANAATHRIPALLQTLLQVLVRTLLPNRPDRHEPRVRKRRPKAFPLMKQPRSTLKRKLAN